MEHIDDKKIITESVLYKQCGLCFLCKMQKNNEKIFGN